MYSEEAAGGIGHQVEKLFGKKQFTVLFAHKWIQVSRKGGNDTSTMEKKKKT